MSTALKVVVSQRVEVLTEHGERRDALDQRLCQWLIAAGCIPVPVPNALTTPVLVDHDQDLPGLQSWLLSVKADALVLSGGNDIGEAPERDNTERRLLAYAKDCDLPVLGICRGMQMMAVWAGGSLTPVSGHVHTRHCFQATTGTGVWPDEVNSFHNFALADCPDGYIVTGRSEDGTIEAIRHEILPWEGWMWHPEREPQFSQIDVMRFRALLDLRRAI